MLRLLVGRERLPFRIDGWLVLLNHMRCVWTLPPDDADYPARIHGVSRAAGTRAETPASVARPWIAAAQGRLAMTKIGKAL